MRVSRLLVHGFSRPTLWAKTAWSPARCLLVAFRANETRVTPSTSNIPGPADVWPCPQIKRWIKRLVFKRVQPKRGREWVSVSGQWNEGHPLQYHGQLWGYLARKTWHFLPPIPTCYKDIATLLFRAVTTVASFRIAQRMVIKHIIIMLFVCLFVFTFRHHFPEWHFNSHFFKSLVTRCWKSLHPG